MNTLSRRIWQTLGASVVLLMLAGCEQETRPDVDANKVASELVSQANEPLMSQNTQLWARDVTSKKITKFSLSFVDYLTKGKYDDARALFSQGFQERYPAGKLEQKFNRILAKTGKDTKVIESSLIIDKTLISTEKKGIADIYVSVKGDLGLKALYVSLCSESEQVKVCHIGWGTEDSGEDPVIIGRV